MAAGRELPIIGSYDRQRFLQFNPEDAANWYTVPNPKAKKKAAMYPTMGRRHINFVNENKLIFDVEPRAVFKSRNFSYYVVFNKIIRVDPFFNQVVITTGNADFKKTTGNVWFAVIYSPGATYCGFTDGTHLYVYTEETGAFDTITDSKFTLTIKNPTYIASIQNRFVVSDVNSSQFMLSAINLIAGTSSAPNFSPAQCFTVSGQAIFAQETGIIRQMAVSQNILYIFTDFTTGIWANIQSAVVNPASGQATTFPLKKNTSFQFQYGISDPLSLSVDFGFMVWLGQSESGLTQVVASSGQAPKPISTKAIDVLFQASASTSMLSPFVEFDATGFLYQYENTIFYRLSAGTYQDFQLLDIQTHANSIEFNFDTGEWYRAIELNGERNRIQQHIYFANRHLVTVQGETTVYEMSGDFYDNEIRNTAEPDPQAIDAYSRQPFRYERVTPIISEPDYSEFQTDWMQIDFMWGNQTFTQFSGATETAEFITTEGGEFLLAEQDVNGNPAYMITENSNMSVATSNTYFNLFKPSIELLYSDDGGVSFSTADVLEFSELGIYSWRMRWYQLGCSRNRVYKLICVSPAPIVVLGGWQLTRRVSGGAS